MTTNDTPLQGGRREWKSLPIVMKFSSLELQNAKNSMPGIVVPMPRVFRQCGAALIEPLHGLLEPSAPFLQVLCEVNEPPSGRNPFPRQIIFRWEDGVTNGNVTLWGPGGWQDYAPS